MDHRRFERDAGPLAALRTTAILWASLLGGSLSLSGACMAQQAPVSAANAPMTTADATLRFEVASVRENRSDAKAFSNLPLGPGPQYVDIGGHLMSTNQLLLGYIVFAYKPTMYQIQQFRAQLPDWTRGAHYDIQARVDGHPGKDELRVMMQALLADRFKLKVHRETRREPVYALELTKVRPGTGLRVHPADDPACAKADMPEAMPGTYPASCGAAWQTLPKVAGNFRIVARGMTPAMLAASIAGTGNIFDRPVVDATGLTGTYDYDLEFAPETAIGADAAPTGAPFSEALRAQLGLKLVPQKGAVEVIVIDHIERPSEN